MGKLKNLFSGYLTALGAAVLSGLDKISSKITKGIANAAALIATIKADYKAFGEAIDNFKESFARALANAANKAVKTLTDYAVSGAHLIADGLKLVVAEAEKLWVIIKDHAKSTVKAVVDGLKAAVAAVRGWLSSIGNRIKSLFSRLARGRVSYKKAFRMMNRRLFRNSRRRRSTKY